MILNFTLNEQARKVLIDPAWTLLDLLRDDQGLTGTKCACDTGECGLCAVLLDGRPALSCLVMAATCEGRTITTIEGLKGEAFDHLKEAFAEEGATQCGFCTPSIALVLTRLLEEDPQADYRKALSGHICRCTGYIRIFKAYERARENLYPSK